MHPHKPDFDLLNLRRQLEEILAMVKADPGGAVLDRSVAESSRVQPEQDAVAAEPEIILTDESPEPEKDCEPAMNGDGQPDDRDNLYDDALVILTEFGQATPAILQMWLSIDYARAITILDRFQADGLISSKGKVRHKAFSIRRALEQQA